MGPRSQPAQDHRLQLIGVFDRRSVVQHHVQPVPPLTDRIVFRPHKDIHGFPRHHLALLRRFDDHVHRLPGMDRCPRVGRWLHGTLRLSHRLGVGLGRPHLLRHRFRPPHDFLPGLSPEKPGRDHESQAQKGKRRLHSRGSAIFISP